MKHKGEFPNMASMDEMPCYFEIPRSSTFDRRDVSIVKVKTTGYERLHFTVALTTGVKRENDRFPLFRLPPLITFKNLKKISPGKYPARIHDTTNDEVFLSLRYLEMKVDMTNIQRLGSTGEPRIYYFRNGIMVIERSSD